MTAPEPGRAWNCIHVIGIDDSGAVTLPQQERELIEAADLLCGGRRHLELFPDGAAERIRVGADLEPVCERLATAPGSRRAVVLASGDPCFFGIGPLLVKHLGIDRVRIHPHPSSVAMAFARLGLAWQDATVLSAHGRPIAETVPAALRSEKLAILTDPEHTPAAVAKALLAAGMSDCPAYVCERLGGGAERIEELTLSALPGRSFDPVNVLILLRPPSPTAEPAFGRPDAAYLTVRGQITKAEVRAVALSRLEPWRARCAWDVGAGAGSVAIEMAGLMPSGIVAAVEHDPEQIDALRKNVDALAPGRVQIIRGSAPEALEPLSDPDAIFVGGGGPRLGEILRLCATRLRPAGRLVANVALLESLGVWQAVAAELAWPADIVEVSVARGAPLGTGTHLSALSPVFVTRLVRPGDAP